MTSPEHQALRRRRQFLLQQIALAADEVKKIDLRLEILASKPGES
jgi:hypothetical protein